MSLYSGRVKKRGIAIDYETGGGTYLERYKRILDGCSGIACVYYSGQPYFSQFLSYGHSVGAALSGVWADSVNRLSYIGQIVAVSLH